MQNLHILSSAFGNPLRAAEGLEHRGGEPRTHPVAPHRHQGHPHYKGIKAGGAAIERNCVEGDVHPVVESHVGVPVGHPIHQLDPVGGNALAPQMAQQALATGEIGATAVLDQQARLGNGPQHIHPEIEGFAADLGEVVEAAEAQRLGWITTARGRQVGGGLIGHKAARQAPDPFIHMVVKFGRCVFRIADVIVHRRHSRGAMEADVMALNRCAALGQQGQPRGAHAGGGVHQDVNLIIENDLAGLGILQGRHGANPIHQAMQHKTLLCGHLQGFVEENLQAFAIVEAQKTF